MQNATVRFHLDPELLASTAEGRHNFLNQIKTVCETAGMHVELLPNNDRTRRAVADQDGYDLFHMDAPTHARALTVRRVYHYPFWAIEPHAERWRWRVAQTEFPGAAPGARRFADYWRDRLFGEAQAKHMGYVYVPLQGRIRDHRSFQSCAPIDMIRAVLRNDPKRNVVATLHPSEDYDAADLKALEKLDWAEPRLSIQTGEMQRHLLACDYVVTENSSAAFNGFFFHKPCVLFAKIDFHHIAANVVTLGEEEAFRQVRDMRPDYDGYIHWFWQIMSINAGRPEAGEKIAEALRRGGWPV